MQEDHLVEHLLDIRDEVGGEDDGGVLVVVADDGAENVVAGGGVDAADRLIEKIQLRFPAHHQNELQLFARALAHGFDARLLVKPEVPDHLLRLVAVKILEKVGVIVHRLLRTHPLAERVALR